MDKEMERLELLSLVNRVSQEIFNFTGNQDKTLAEFVISVSRPVAQAASMF
jgi:ATP-dependent RNA helicase DHX8/PRP22